MTEHNKGTDQQCTHLYQAHLRELFGRCLTCEIEQLQEQVRKLRKEHAEEIRDLQRETREVASEVRWQERLGEDYGSY